MSMTRDQAHRLRVLIQEAFELVLNKPVAFVLVAQDEERGLEIVTNAERRDLLPDLLIVAAEIVRTPPDTTIDMSDHRATGESAGVKSAQEATPGMECGHAAPQPSTAEAKAGLSQESLGQGDAAAPAVSERCWRRIPPGFEEQCPHDATGGIRLKLYPALAIQKRYGKRDMLALILDLPVCAECFGKMTAIEVLNNLGPDQWQAFTKVAQQRNHGILPIKEQCEIEHLPFDDAEYEVLRSQLAKKAANESQPAPAGPQQGAGDGKS